MMKLIRIYCNSLSKLDRKSSHVFFMMIAHFICTFFNVLSSHPKTELRQAWTPSHGIDLNPIRRQ